MFEDDGKRGDERVAVMIRRPTVAIESTNRRVSTKDLRVEALYRKRNENTGDKKTKTAITARTARIQPLHT